MGDDLDMAECIGLRLTEQTAVLSALLMGFQGGGARRVYRDTLRTLVARTLEGPLRTTRRRYPVLIGPSVLTRVRKRDQRPIAPVSLIVTALDGALALREGRSGTLTTMLAVTGAGDSTIKWSRQPSAAQQESFFVAVAGPAVTSAPGFAPGTPAVVRRGPLAAQYRALPVRTCLAAAFRSGIIHPIVGLTFEDSYFKDFVPDFGAGERRRRLDGSSLAAAIAALLDKVSVSVFIARRAHLIQIAAAVRALGGQMWAVPFVQEAGTPRNMEKIQIPVVTRVLGADDFLRKQAAARLITSSVTEICYIDRVRYLKARRVTVSSLILASNPPLRREITTTLDLDDATFIGADGVSVKAGKVVADMHQRMKELGN